jgi:hypothetical protein
MSQDRRDYVALWYRRLWGKKKKVAVRAATMLDRETDRETERQRDRETERQRDRETERQTDRQTDIHTDRQTDCRARSRWLFVQRRWC